MDNSITPKIKEWLNARGISDAIISQAALSMLGGFIRIPIFNSEGNFLFHKFRRNPFDSDETTPKYTYEKGATVQLYCADDLNIGNQLIICEGEFDCLALLSKGFNAVSSTGGATSFQESWAPLFAGKETFVCFDNDKAGIEGMIKVCRMIPHAKVIPLPKEVGEHGDITDFFTKLGKTADDFKILMAVASPIPPPKPEPRKRKHKRGEGTDLEEAKKIPLARFLKINHAGFAKCQLHPDKTPSLKCYKDNRWYCYSCGQGGDVIYLVMKMLNLTLPKAVAEMMKKQDQ